MATLLDNFNRTNENPLNNGGVWGGPIFSGDGQLQIQTNVATGQASGWANSYHKTKLAANQEVEVKVSTLVTSRFIAPYARIQNPGTGSLNAYTIEVSTSAGTWELYRIKNAGESLLGTGSKTLSVGDKIRLSCNGSTIKAIHITSGGTETVVIEKTNGEVTGEGYIGCAILSSGVEVAIDDFSGNAIGGPSTAEGQAALSGTGAITAKGVTTRLGKATVVGTGAVTTKGLPTRLGNASVAGAGTITAKGLSTKFGKATVAGIGSVTGAAFEAFDTFNRADGLVYTGAPQWQNKGINAASSQLEVIGEQFGVNTSATNGITANKFGPTIEVRLTASTLMNTSEGYIFMAARIQEPGSNAWDGYAAIFLRTSPITYVHQLRRYDNGASTVLGGTASTKALATGDVLGFSITGNTLKLLRKPVGENWEELASREDTTYPSAGYVGFESGDIIGRYDDLYVIGPKIANTVEGKGAVVGTGSLTAKGSKLYTGVGSVAGIGAIKATGIISSFNGKVIIAGTGAIAAKGTRIKVTQGSIAGTSQIKGVGRLNPQIRRQGFPFPFSYSIIKKVAAKPIQGKGTITGGGLRIAPSTAKVIGIGAIMPKGGTVRASEAHLTALGTITPKGIVIRAGRGTIIGQGQLSLISGIRIVFTKGSVSGSGAVIGSSQRIVTTAGLVAGTGLIKGAGQRTVSSSGSVVGVGLVKGAGVRIVGSGEATGVITGKGTISAQALHIAPGIGVVKGVGTISAVGSNFAKGSGTILGQALVKSIGRTVKITSASLVGSGSIIPIGEIPGQITTRATVLGTGLILGGGYRIVNGVGFIKGDGTIVGSTKPILPHHGRIGIYVRHQKVVLTRTSEDSLEANVVNSLVSSR